MNSQQRRGGLAEKWTSVLRLVVKTAGNRRERSGPTSPPRRAGSIRSPRPCDHAGRAFVERVFQPVRPIHPRADQATPRAGARPATQTARDGPPDCGNECRQRHRNSLWACAQANTTEEQFAASPDLNAIFDNVIIDSMDAQKSIADELLNYPDKRALMIWILLNQLGLYEKLKARATGV